MRINPAVAYTLILLTLMFGAGVVSSSWGYALGRKALTGVRQPETQPASAAAASSEGSGHFTPLAEDEILAEVEARMTGQPGVSE
ncbi:hypothetical protein IQ241_19745 [Romeria aff. gracilis LEGE 07310]|uniref:Uncharacterized protein n=1 Tax=Vasconcelosia minhoensis LEGE 07310 TaxID=915328 RepID=A0A8J7A924_9CYAN|nr:hypothetical protein [Romeria gracilis]MBE9079502.1 hypothetical protein [Romeria aff. gracilis LEGE 07310]